MNTLEEIGQLKENNIIVMTALSLDPNEIEKLMHQGITSFLPKPVSIEKLLETIESVKTVSC